LLEDEREKYVNFIVAKHPGFYPDILSSESLFLRECKKSNRRRVAIVKRKQQDGEVQKEGEE
jgi:hypothetical protein